MAEKETMNKVNRDPTGFPPVGADLIQQAKAENYQIVHVVCAQYEGNDEHGSCVSFMAMTPFLPRPGDKIQLEDDQFCIVTRVYFKVGRLGENFALVPTVYAARYLHDEY